MPIARLQLDVNEYQHTLSSLEVALTRDRFTQVELRRRLNTWLGTTTSRVSYVVGTVTSPFPFQSYVDTYSEVETSDAIGDLEKLAMRAGAQLTSGGVPTGLSTLVYLPRNIRVNTISLSSLGEGIAGYYLEQIVGLNPICRPILVTPDFIVQDVNTGLLAMVEIKATLQENVITPLKKAAIDLLDILSKNILMHSGPYSCFAIGVVVRPDLHEITALNLLTCELHSLRMDY